MLRTESVLAVWSFSTVGNKKCSVSRGRLLKQAMENEIYEMLADLLR